MRWLLLLIPIALAALMLFLLRDESVDRHDRGTEGDRDAEATQHAESGTERGRTGRSGGRHAPEVAATETMPPLAPEALEVTVRNEHGESLSGIVVELRHEHTAFAKGETAERGIVRFEGVRLTDTTVYVLPGGDYPSVFLGRWGKSEELVRMSATLSAPRDILIRVRINGAPGLPSGFTLRAPRLVHETQDFQTGEIRGQIITLGRDVRLDIDLTANLLVDRSTLVAKENAGVLESTIELVRGIRVELRGPNVWEYAHDLRVESNHPDGSWGVPFGWSRRPILLSREKTKKTRFVMAPGHHRLVLHTLGLEVQKFEVSDYSKRGRLNVDVGTAQWLRVNVVAPSGYDLSGETGASVRGDGISSGVTVRSGERFLHPGDRDLDLTAFGPGLRPHPERGSLRMRQGGRVTLELTGDTSAFLTCTGSKAVRIRLVSRDSDQRTVHSAVSEAPFRFANLPRGTFDVVVHTEGSVPSLLEAVAFGDNPVNLGHIETGNGTMLSVQLKNRAKQWVHIDATWLPLGLPIKRPPQSMGNGRWILYGLPPGKVRLDFQMGDRKWSRVVTTSISGKQSIEVDCAAD